MTKHEAVVKELEELKGYCRRLEVHVMELEKRIKDAHALLGVTGGAI